MHNDEILLLGPWGFPEEDGEEPEQVPQTPELPLSPAEPEEGETEETTAPETLEVTGETLEPEPEPLPPDSTHGWCFVIMGVLAALVLGLLIALIAGAFRPRKRKKAPAAAVPPTTVAPAPAAPGGIRMGMLHCQGDRESQQDCMAVSPLEMYGTRGVLAVVADGMGGLSDGDRMSRAASAAMLEGFLESRDPDPLLALTARANQVVNNLLGPERLGTSGTTLVAGIVREGLFRYVSVGDSRICLYRQGELIQLNREHSYRYELLTRAVNGMGTLWDAQTHPNAGGLTSFLGMGALKYVDIPAEPLRLRAGDKLILMSDGVYNALTLAELEQALTQSAQSAADAIARMIQAKAYRNQDNYTAVILEF